MELLSRAVFSVKCGWINPWCLTFNQPVRLLNIELRHGHKLTFALSLHHLCDVLFWRFKGLVCAQRVSKPQRGSVALCLTGTSLHIGPNPGHGPGAYVSQSRHPKPEPRSPEWRPCVPGRGGPRCKQHFVCRLQFWERPFCDRSRSVPVGARWLFCFLAGDEECLSLLLQ